MLGSRARSLPAGLLLLAVLAAASACASLPFADSAQAHLERGIALYERGRYADAVLALEEAIAKDPALADAYLYLARSQLRLGRWFAALATLGDAFTHVPAREQRALLGELLDSFIQGALGLLREGKPGDATTLLTRLHELAPDSAETRAALVDALLADGRDLLAGRDWSEAVARFARALELAPPVSKEQLDAYVGLARGFLASGELGRAIDVLRQALDAAPGNERVLELLRELLRS